MTQRMITFEVTASRRTALGVLQERRFRVEATSARRARDFATKIHGPSLGAGWSWRVRQRELALIDDHKTFYPSLDEANERAGTMVRAAYEEVKKRKRRSR